MKHPDEVRELLTRRYANNHRAWLDASTTGDDATNIWPMEISLGVPTEKEAQRHPEDVRAWAQTWQRWSGAGTLTWIDRQWRTLGTQRLPEKLTLTGPDQIVAWTGNAEEWIRAKDRCGSMIQQWHSLAGNLGKHFDVLAHYSEADFSRLYGILLWMTANPQSNLYVRQVPVSGIDSKWIESRKSLISDLVVSIQEKTIDQGDFYQRCGLRPPPQLIRMRVLDSTIRKRIGGFSDITAPVDEIAAMDIHVNQVCVVENLQTGLAFADIPNTVVFMRLGYGVDVLGRIPWLKTAKCIYWGDIDTHGFAILSRARTHLPAIESVLMDKSTLLTHRELWTEEQEPHKAVELPLLTTSEQKLYDDLRLNTWGQNVRLEQERVNWGSAWKVLLTALRCG